MLKTIPIRLEVEVDAFGVVLLRLHEMRGIAKLDLELGHGGTKPATKSNGSGELQSQVIAALIRGQRTVAQLIAATGLDKKRIYGVVHNLKQKNFVKTAGIGTYVLTEKAKQGLKVEKPAPAAKSPSGRAKQGSGAAILVACLSHQGPSKPVAIAQYFAKAGGPSPKSISGVIERAKRDKLITKEADGYALTAKGRELANG
jgi:predicted transcriptional regulator